MITMKLAFLDWKPLYDLPVALRSIWVGKRSWRFADSGYYISLCNQTASKTITVTLSLDCQTTKINEIHQAIQLGSLAIAQGTWLLYRTNDLKDKYLPPLCIWIQIDCSNLGIPEW